MTFYYIVRDVKAGHKGSYPLGRTLLNDVHRNEGEARQRCERYNECKNSPFVLYVVVPHDDCQPFDCDHYESNPHPLRAEGTGRTAVGMTRNALADFAI